MRKSCSLLLHGKDEAGASSTTNANNRDQGDTDGNGNGNGGGYGEVGDSDGYSPSRTESYIESSDNDNGSDIANWEEYVASDGSLFYAEYLDMHDECTIEDAKHSGQTAQQNKNSTGNQQQQQQQHQHQQMLPPPPPSASLISSSSHEKQQNERTQPLNKFTFSTIEQCNNNCKIIEMIITAADRYRYGRRSTITESILGFRVAPFADQTKYLMVDGFVYDVPHSMEQDQQYQSEQQQQQQLHQQHFVKRGDWFKSLNGIDVDTSNVNNLLLQFVEPTKVQLQFYGHKKNQIPVGQVKNNYNNKTNARTITAKRIENDQSLADLFELQILSSISTMDANVMIFGLLILPSECYKNDQYKNSLFFYPNDPEKNFLYKARGSFFTLYSVLNDELKTKPTSSKLTSDSVQYNVCYRQINGFLVLFSYFAKIIELSECNLRSDELIMYMNLFMSDMSLQSFDNRDFQKVMVNLCKTQHADILVHFKKEKVSPPLELAFKESRYLPLPKEGQLRMLDALSEMDAMDYRSWNEEPLTTHREFFICGNVLYYNHMMLISQMSPEMRQYVETYLRCHGIFSFVNNNRIKEIYIWLEIMLPNVEGRHFLSICGRNHLLLAVILKLFEPDRKIVQKISPSLFYIEEMQETLNHLIYCGIESLAMYWSASNKRPETLLGSSIFHEHVNSSKKQDNKQKLANATSSSSIMMSSNSQLKLNISYDDETLLCSSLAGSSLYSLSPSEEASHKRRTPPSNNRNADDSDSDSDWENFSQFHQGPLSDFEPEGQATQVKKSLWKEIANIVPIKISPGWENSIYYFLYVDNSNSTIFCPHIMPSEMLPFMSDIRRNFLLIRNILQCTKHSYRDMGKTVVQDAVTIREYGTTLEICQTNNNTRNNIDDQMITKIRLSMVGRLFLQPPREVYICHHPDIPYNMVEVAYRLSFFPTG